MPFSTNTLFAACSFLGEVIDHGEFDDLMLKWGLDHIAIRYAGQEIHQRCRVLFVFLRDSPQVESDGRAVRDLVVEVAVSKLRRRAKRLGAAEFIRSLERDGYTAEDGELRPALPKFADLPAADDEVHLLLQRYNLITSMGHLDQAVDAHQRGDWAAANGQLRTFCESLFDEIAMVIDSQNASSLKAGETRRQFLANLNPPFLMRSLNEWSDDGKNFVNGVFKRLHAQGSHPGLSDEEDCTFRLHLVLVVARFFLRRLANLGK